jgi:hypothetical protein
MDKLDDQNNSEKFFSGLKKIRKRKNVFFVFVTSIAFIIIAGSMIKNKIIFVPIVIAWFILLVILGKIVEYSICPRCKKYFYQKQYGFLSFSFPFRRSCINCGLSFDSYRKKN